MEHGQNVPLAFPRQPANMRDKWSGGDVSVEICTLEQNCLAKAPPPCHSDWRIVACGAGVCRDYCVLRRLAFYLLACRLRSGRLFSLRLALTASVAFRIQTVLLRCGLTARHGLWRMLVGHIRCFLKLGGQWGLQDRDRPFLQGTFSRVGAAPTMILTGQNRDGNPATQILTSEALNHSVKH